MSALVLIRTRVFAAATATAVAGGLLMAATSAQADVSPVVDRPSNVVTADALPTAQINGVAWAQVIVGDKVFVGGSFTSARPAGSAAGTNETSRTDLMAYSLSTGVMTSWAPVLNNQVKSLAVSPDGRTLYAGGQFTSVNGKNRQRLAAFDVASGALLTNFQPSPNYNVDAIVATADTVYLGGEFVSVNGQTRNRLAAATAATGALTAWAPSADSNVAAMVLTTKADKLVIGGQFTNLSGAAAYGLAAIDPTSGATVPWATAATVQDAGKSAGITSLTKDSSAIYGTGFVYGPGGNLEGMFSANQDTGAVNWVEDCHGDSYGAYSTGSTVYVVSHAHFCGDVGGFPQTGGTDSSKWTYHRATAFTTAVTGTLDHNPYGNYTDWFGTPSPSLENWFPDLVAGTFTGQAQAAWTVTGNGKYTVLGGEFPTVNGVAQQGLVRFATTPTAPGKMGPLLAGAYYPVSTLALSATQVRVSFPLDWDRDDLMLSYKLIRDGNLATPVYSTTTASPFWNRPNIGFIDSGLTPGSTHTYRAYVTDSTGNVVDSNVASVTLPAAGGATTAYANQVVADGASSYWPLAEASGSVGYDHVGFNDLTLGTGISRGTAGAVPGDTASALDGSTAATGSTSTAITGPNTFSVSTWVRTTSTTGGRVIGFSNQPTATSNNYDRMVYLDASGKVWFGVYPGSTATLTSPQAINDGAWHQIVASLSPAGMVLSVDGQQVGTRSDVTAGQAYSGYWRLGTDNTNGWPGSPSTGLTAAVGEVAIYPSALSRSAVQAEYQASGRAATIAPPPTDSYGQAVVGDNPVNYYRLDDASAPAAADASGLGATGAYSGTEAFGVASPVTGANGRAVTFNGTDGTLASPAVTSPSVYSEELWFNTTTTAGGKLIGFGNQATGASTAYDRHVYLGTDGRLTFGVWTGSQNTATTTGAYNDGKWHYLVASQGANGMLLTIDNQVVATNPQTGNMSSTGYWRVGGDTAWNGTSYFAGTIDEVAVYNSVLSPAQINAHYNASPFVAPPKPVASFTATTNGLSVAVDGSGSSVAGGSITGYAWTFGDGTTGTGATTSHTYAAGGTYTVTLTATSAAGQTGATTRQVSVVAPNVAPTPAFTATVTGATVAVDGSTSTDSDGSVTGYAWTFGDGGTATGPTASHTYTASGSYSVTLTVTDNGGLTASTGHQVTVAVPTPGLLAADTFTRTVSNGWGTADTGGNWTVAPGNAFGVDGAAGMTTLAAGAGVAASLTAMSARDVNIVVDTSVDKAAAGGSLYVSVIGRQVGNSDYRAKLRYLPGGQMQLILSKTVKNVETGLKTVSLPGTYTPGNVLRVRLVITGTPTTTLAATVWTAGTTEPAAQATTTDNDAALQRAGGLGLQVYLATAATNGPVAVRFDNVAVNAG